MGKIKRLKRDSGIVGLDILLSVVIMLFVIGFLVSIFALLGGSLEEETYKSSSGTLTNSTTQTVVNATGAYPLGVLNQGYNCQLTVAFITNNNDTEKISSGNYSVVRCKIIGSAIVNFNNSLWNVTGTFTYDANTSATLAIADTTGELAEVTDWFGIIIVITAMVVLILLTVIIIAAIKGTGMIAMGGGTSRTTA